MCIFTRKVEDVSDTHIFARSGARGQLLAYQMTVKASSELAMVLPIPVHPDCAEDGVRFLDLSGYPELFNDLFRGCFPPVKQSCGGGNLRTFSSHTERLPVVEVGSFVASFVPRLKDFARLDPRFRLPPGTFDRVPEYQSFGYAVFQLKPEHTRVHPMAFQFPSAHPERLFFPTVHIHDGELHKMAHFDHILYCQQAMMQRLAIGDWRESSRPASMFAHSERAQGLLDGEAHVYARRLQGILPNTDTLLCP